MRNMNTKMRIRVTAGLAGLGVLALASCGAVADAEGARGEAPEVTVPARTSAPSATVERLLAVHKQSIEACEKKEAGLTSRPTYDVPPIEELMKAPVQVGGGPDCGTGWVDPIILSDRGNDGADLPHEILAKDGKTLLGYWVNGLGWLPRDIVEDPTFDLDEWLGAEQELSAPRPAEGAGD